MSLRSVYGLTASPSLLGVKTSRIYLGAVILQRFGAPAERIRQGETLEHFLYPAQGLDIVLDSKGKEVLQYVAPADFARLRAPLGK
jgi:hypothetical protein